MCRNGCRSLRSKIKGWSDLWYESYNACARLDLDVACSCILTLVMATEKDIKLLRKNDGNASVIMASLRIAHAPREITSSGQSEINTSNSRREATATKQQACQTLADLRKTTIIAST